MDVNKKCSCGVVLTHHGTACGWDNANYEIDNEGNIISPKEHPGLGKHFRSWWIELQNNNLKKT